MSDQPVTIGSILPHHLVHLRASGLSDEAIVAAGIYSEVATKRVASLLGRKKPLSTFAPAIVFPYKTANGTNGYCRVRPDTPRRDRNDKPVKYESPVEQPNQIYLPPGVAQYLPDSKQELLITEGEKKSLKATQDGFPTIGLVGVYGFVAKGEKRLLPDLAAVNWHGREVRIVFDSDVTTNPNVQAAESLLAKLLGDAGAKVRVVRLPDGPPCPDGKPAKMGLDDFLIAHGKGPLRKLLENAEEPSPVDPSDLKERAGRAEPAEEAELFLKQSELDGVRRLRFYRGEFVLWQSGRYVPVQAAEIRATLYTMLNRFYVYVTTGVVANILAQVQAQALLLGRVKAPAWLDQPEVDWKPDEIIVAKNGLVHIPSVVEKAEAFIQPPTPKFFTTTALDYEFDVEAPEPIRWLEFLQQLWPNDPQAITTLQDWFGYCLTPDTRQQKILLILGPRRSGKGTIARVLSAVVGPDNTAGPTLSGLATNFGLWPLLDKSLAIIADARLSGRTDQAIVVERLLSISGEDNLTVDRKCMEPIKNVKLNTRLMILTNELPRLGDSSGALAGRLIVLRLTESFFGKEDITLTDALLAERPGILRWAIDGWRRLQDRGHFVQPASGKELTEQMEDIASPIGQFVREYCWLDAGHTITVQDLFRGWCCWCKQKNREPGTEQTFGRDLGSAFSQIRRTQPRADDGGRYRAYSGIDLLPEVWNALEREPMESTR